MAEDSVLLGVMSLSSVTLSKAFIGQNQGLRKLIRKRNRSPAQEGCLRQVLGPGALGRPRGIGWRGRWEGESGWGIHVTPWLIHVNVWQNPLKCCEVISLQLIKINEKKKACCLLRISHKSTPFDCSYWTLFEFVPTAVALSFSHLQWYFEGLLAEQGLWNRGKCQARQIYRVINLRGARC